MRIMFLFRLLRIGCARRDKVVYGRLTTAQKAVKAMARKGRIGLEPYWCQHCGGWHIGHGYIDAGLAAQEAAR